MDACVIFKRVRIASWRGLPPALADVQRLIRGEIIKIVSKLY